MISIDTCHEYSFILYSVLYNYCILNNKNHHKNRLRCDARETGQKLHRNSDGSASATMMMMMIMYDHRDNDDSSRR